MTHDEGTGSRTPAGWYPDAQTGGQRYWDGVQWTEHRVPAAGFAPPPPPPPPPGGPFQPMAPALPQAEKPWYQQTKWIVGGVVAALVVIGAATDGEPSDDRVSEASDISSVDPSDEVEDPVQPEPESDAVDDETEQEKPRKKATEKARPQATRPRAVETFVMPATVGMVLQDAQDLLQSKGSYILTQTDAMGWGRFQVLDSGWKVCWQDPAPGTVTRLSFMVDLGVVKLDEACP